VSLKRVKIPEKVLIAGKWWKLGHLTKKEAQSKNKDGLFTHGQTYDGAKIIKYYPVMHGEEMLDTLLHEGLHAILSERSWELGGWKDEERAVRLLVCDVMTFLKQVADVNLKEA
jgi:hypothetical protein